MSKLCDGGAALPKKTNDPETSLDRDVFDKFPEPMWPRAAKIIYSQYTEHALDNAASREEHLDHQPRGPASTLAGKWKLLICS